MPISLPFSERRMLRPLRILSGIAGSWVLSPLREDGRGGTGGTASRSSSSSGSGGKFWSALSKTGWEDRGRECSPAAATRSRDFDRDLSLGSRSEADRSIVGPV